MLIEARAEHDNLPGIEANRKQELKIEKAKVLQELAGKTKILMSGDTGEMFMKQLLDNIPE
jgi:hypothetical protein